MLQFFNNLSLSNETPLFILILGMTLYNLVVILKQNNNKDYLYINLLLLVAGFFSSLMPNIFKLVALAQIFANLIILSRIYNSKYVILINKVMNLLIFALYSINMFSKINLILAILSLLFFMYLLFISNGGNRKKAEHKEEDYYDDDEF